jgi:hypothetical protein
MNSSDQLAATRRALLSRCREAAYVYHARERLPGMDARREAIVRGALDDLVTAGQVRMIQAASLVVYIAWDRQEDQSRDFIL